MAFAIAIRQINVVVKLAGIIDKRKIVYRKSLRYHANQFRHAKDSMSVELDPVRTDRHGKI